MAPVETPVHLVRLLVAAAFIGLLVLWSSSSFNNGAVTMLGTLATLALFIWLVVQPAQKPVLDGFLTGTILGLGLGGLLGYGAYQISDFCLAFECPGGKDPAAFWIWFVPVALGLMLVGAALGSLAAGKGKPIPGLEDLPPVHR